MPKLMTRKNNASSSWIGWNLFDLHILFSFYDFYYSKYGPYDYSSYSGRLGDAVRHPVAQKKHQMFGKRYLQDQSGPNM